MPRVKRGVTARARHKKVLEQAKGYRGRRKNVYRIAKEAVMKAGQYAYRDRRNKKRVFRALWIARINARQGSVQQDRGAGQGFPGLNAAPRTREAQSASLFFRPDARVTDRPGEANAD